MDEKLGQQTPLSRTVMNTQNEVEQAWQEYKEALEKCANATKLTAFHTQETAKAVEEVCNATLLTTYHIKEYIKSARKELPR